MPTITSFYNVKNIQKFVSLLLIILLYTVTTPFAMANDDAIYKTEQVVKDGKESKETDAILKITKGEFSVTPDKAKYKDLGKTFAFDKIKVADYSFSKKPMLSGGGAVATALLVGFIFALPFLFIKKKSHWMTVQTENDFVVMKLDGSNYRQIVAEFETHGVKVNTIDEDKEKKDKDKDKKDNDK